MSHDQTALVLSDPEGQHMSKQAHMAKAAFHLLTAEMLKLQPMKADLSIATDTYASLDEMVDLIRAKLAHSDSLTLWAVDSAESETEGVTICITGNNEKGEDHAKWIATMWANMPMVLDHMDSLLTENRTLTAALAEREAEIVRMRIRVDGLGKALRVITKQAALIWDGDEPVQANQGSHLDAILFEAKTALDVIAAAAAPREPDRTVG